MNIDEITKIADMVGCIGVYASRISSVIQPLPECAEVDVVHYLCMRILDSLESIEKITDKADEELIVNRNLTLYNIDRADEDEPIMGDTPKENTDEEPRI